MAVAAAVARGLPPPDPMNEEKEGRLPVSDPTVMPSVELDGATRAQQIESLILDHAKPTMERIITHFLYASSLQEADAHDVVATVTLRLIRKLQAPEISERDPIRQFDSYVARLTYNTIYDTIRRRFPERTKLKNRLRYLASSDRRLALWTAPSGVAVGLAKWHGADRVLERADVGIDSASTIMLDRERPADALEAVLRSIGSPILLNSLTGIMATLWGVSDVEVIRDQPLVDEKPTPLARLESREFLGALWDEIRQLKPEHRTALLLNLRDPDGHNGMALLVLTGVATLDALAEALGMTTRGLAELWPSLPVDDLTIAATLGVNRQQVINYRRSARERLTRKMGLRFAASGGQWAV